MVGRGVEGSELLECAGGTELLPLRRAAASRFFRMISAKPPAPGGALVDPLLLLLSLGRPELLAFLKLPPCLIAAIIEPMPPPPLEEEGFEAGADFPAPFPTLPLLEGLAKSVFSTVLTLLSLAPC